MKWEGKFSTLSLPFGSVGGYIVVDHVDLNRTGYTSLAHITYSGLYKHGKKFDVEVKVEDNEMSVKLDGHTIQFKIEKKTNDMITGNYVVKGLDRGQFYLQPAGSKPINNDQCIIF